MSPRALLLALAALTLVAPDRAATIQATGAATAPPSVGGDLPSPTEATGAAAAPASVGEDLSTPTKATGEVAPPAQVSANAPAPAEATDDQRLVPPDKSVGQWVRDGETETFAGEAIYNHIDGAGELFLEFGFDSVTVQRYHEGEAELTLEIYRMKDQEAALGVHLMKCGREERDPSFKPRHTVGQFQLMFQRGRYFVLATCPQGGAERKRTLLEFGRFVADRVEGDKPLAIWDLLPRQGLIESSRRLIRGPFALQSLITLGEGDVLQLGGKLTAVAADYEQRGGSPSTRLVVEYPDRLAAREAFERLRSGLDPELKVTASWTSRFDFIDHAGKYGIASVSKTRLTIVFGLNSPTAKDSAV